MSAEGVFTSSHDIRTVVKHPTNEQFRATSQQHLDYVLEMLPQWVLDFRWEYEEPEDGTNWATAYTNYGSRGAKISVTPLFFALPWSEQRRTVLHEVIHLYQGPEAAITSQVLNSLREMDQRLADVFSQQLSEARESTTEDLTRLIER